MIKYLKLASYLSIAVALSTTVIAGIGLTRDNETVSERAELLNERSVIEIFREAKIPKADEDTTPPLVKQAKAFALRIDPPPPPRPKPQPAVSKNINTGSRPTETVIEKYEPPVNTNFNLLATCVYENHPEKSLAMIDLTSKGQKWVRQGDTVGHKVIHQINDGSIVLYQNGSKSGTLRVPPKAVVSSLIQTGDSKMPTHKADSSVRPSNRAEAHRRYPSSKRPNTRHLQQRGTNRNPQMDRQTAKRNAEAMTKMLNKMENKGEEKKKPEDIMKMALEMLKNASKKPETEPDTKK